LKVATQQQSTHWKLQLNNKAKLLSFSSWNSLTALQVKTHFSCCGMMHDGWVPDTAHTAKL
jgi:hypothetical protein